MSNLKHWQDKIKEKRKHTPFREFLKEIGSWTSIGFTKNNGLISRYPESDRVKICHYEEFEQNRDDLIKYGSDYDFSINFFKNYEKLFRSIEIPNFHKVGENENCDYVDTAVSSKNSYLSSIVTLGSENVFYSSMVRENSVNIFNSFYVITNNQNIYFSSHILDGSYNIFYSRYIKNSSNLWFCSNLTGCSECIFCDDLQNCSYYIENKKYKKEEYFKKKQEILRQKSDFLKWYKHVNKIGNNYNSTECIGNCILDSSKIENGYGVFNMLNGRNLMFTGSEETGENCFDLLFGGKGTINCYGVSNFGGNPDNIYVGYNVGYSSNIYYSNGLDNCSFCIGCVGLKNKSYCILNKQHTKEEWYELADKIFSQMEKDGILGDYFPGYINPIYFNDTFAYLFGDFSKEEVESEGYMWRNEEIKVDIPKDAEIIKTIPPQSPFIKGGSQNVVETGGILDDFQGYDENGNWYIDPEILKKVIVDEKGNYYRIVKMEYDFLMKHGLPLPEIHWMDRMKLNFGV